MYDTKMAYSVYLFRVVLLNCLFKLTYHSLHVFLERYNLRLDFVLSIFQNLHAL